MRKIVRKKKGRILYTDCHNHESLKKSNMKESAFLFLLWIEKEQKQKQNSLRKPCCVWIGLNLKTKWTLHFSSTQCFCFVVCLFFTFRFCGLVLQIRKRGGGGGEIEEGVGIVK